jgi:MarR family transcriptional regulator, temperature-dependent positive regulator of motility
MEPKQSRANVPQGTGAEPWITSEEADTSGRALIEILTINPTRLAYRLNYVANYYTGPLYKHLEQRWGLSRPDYITLFCLHQLPGLRARDIVAICGRPKNSISRAVNGLLGKGYLQRSDADSGRGQPLSLTAAGQEIVQQIIPLFVSREVQMLDPLTAAERQTLDTILGKLCFRNDDWNAAY